MIDARPRTAAATVRVVRPAAETGTTATTGTAIGTGTVIVTAAITVTATAIVTETETETVIGVGEAGLRRGGGAPLPNVGGTIEQGRPLRRTSRRSRTGIGIGKERGIVRRRLLMITEFSYPCRSDSICLQVLSRVCFMVPKNMRCVFVVHDASSFVLSVVRSICRTLIIAIYVFMLSTMSERTRAIIPKIMYSNLSSKSRYRDVYVDSLSCFFLFVFLSGFFQSCFSHSCLLLGLLSRLLIFFLQFAFFFAVSESVVSTNLRCIRICVE